MKEAEMERVGEWIDRALLAHASETELEKIHSEVKEFCGGFPLPSER